MKQPKPIEQAANADLRGSWPALQRAAQCARQIAAQTGTAGVVVRDGKLEHFYPPVTQTQSGVQEEPAPYMRPL